MPFKEACLLLGLHPRTIWKWDKQGKMRTVRTIGSGRRIPESEICRLRGEGIEKHIRLRGGLFFRTERDDLERQIDLLRQRGAQEVISDIGSGLNGKRKGFLRPLDRILRKEVGRVIIACEDRLTRFRFDTLRRILRRMERSSESGRV